MPKFHVIVPAAGTGSRFGSAVPKQYLPLLDQALILHTLRVLCRTSSVASVSVVLSAADDYWQAEYQGEFSPRLKVLRCGGDTRAETVSNALACLRDSGVGSEDWVLVHDAARPCLSLEALENLIQVLMDDPVGGILAVPVADTLKRADADARVADTISRDGLWQAQTPQMFRCGLLSDALKRFPHVTDEAGAVEAAGFKPKLVAGDASNLKVTYPSDFALAAAILSSRLTNK
jgi:2-C-methyl-D-erythritol 4-phosphate cytidylyltransferase